MGNTEKSKLNNANASSSIYEYRESHVRRRTNKFRLTFVKLYRYIFDILLFYIAWILFRYGSLTDLDPYGFRYNYYVTIAYAIVLLYFVRVYHGNLLGYTRIRSLLFAQALSQIFSVSAIYVAVTFAWHRFRNPVIFLVLLIVQFAIDVLWCYYASEYYFRIYPERKTLLIYRNSLDKKRVGLVKGKPIERLYRITDEIEFDGSFDEIKDKL